MYLGNWRARRGRRDDLVIASKVAGPGNGLTYLRNGPRLDRAHIRKACEDSLQRLKTDYMDLYQVHWPDRNANFFGKLGYQHQPDEQSTAIEETLEALHELVQEVSEFFVLKQAGYSTKKALLLNFLVSSTILIGAVGSTVLLGVFANLEVPLMGIAAGAFLVVVFQDLIPHSVREAKVEASHFKHLGWFALGVIIMLGVNTIAVHGHGDDDDEHSEIHQYDHVGKDIKEKL
jgi:hypothetical protein